MTTQQPTKRCAKCKIEKPESDFYSAGKKYTKLHSYCKTCFKEKADVYREKYNAKIKDKLNQRIVKQVISDNLIQNKNKKLVNKGDYFYWV